MDETIIKNHINNYPKMEVVDLIKLLYQNEFGGGHLIKDPIQSLNYLKLEYSKVVKINCPLYEHIGNNIVRVNLSSLMLKEEKLEKLNELFVKSSSEVKGNIKSFKRKIEHIKKLVKEDNFNFSYDEFMSFLNEYENKNYPMVSHSQTYKELYNPSYRIILIKYVKDLY